MNDEERETPMRNLYQRAENGGHIDTVGLAMMFTVVLILLLAYMRAQGKLRAQAERLARLEAKQA